MLYACMILVVIDGLMAPPMRVLERGIGGGCLSPVCDVGVLWVAGLVVPHGAMGGRSLPLSVESGPFVMLCVALSM